MKEQLAAWLLSTMLTWVPTSKAGDTSPDIAHSRFESIASDIAAVAETRKQAALLLSIAYYESSFQAAVDAGIKRGDLGRSYCLAQLNVGAGKTAEGWTGAELIADRKKCFASALNLMQRSLNACKSLPEEDRLSAYTSGKCIENEPKARLRYRRAAAMLNP